jgi:cytidine deaminase
MESSQLLQEAILARAKAYVPYSNFAVGAALLDRNGQVHHGCNIENAGYTPCNCAERTALFSAIAQGQQPGSFQMMAVVGDTDEPIAPCGVCRQVMVELCQPDMPILLGNMKSDTRLTTISELLPHAFGPWNLNK